MKGMKTGGRKKGVPNKENPLKGYLASHSLEYFKPREQQIDGAKQTISDFELDMLQLAPDDRVAAEIRLLEFHTPKRKAVDIDLDAQISAQGIEDLLSSLASDG